MSETNSKRRYAPGLAVPATILLSFATQIIASAAPITLNFDELAAGYNLTNNGYAGLNWEIGNPGIDGILGNWVTPISPTANHPSSMPRNSINGAGSTLMGVGFPGTVNMGGAFFAVQGDPGSVSATAIRIHGYADNVETAVTGWLTPLTTTPQWLDMVQLTEVNRILVEADHLPFSSMGAFGMDDLTFTYVPEPTTLAVCGVAVGAGMLRRRR